MGVGTSDSAAEHRGVSSNLCEGPVSVFACSSLMRDSILLCRSNRVYACATFRASRNSCGRIGAPLQLVDIVHFYSDSSLMQYIRHFTAAIAADEDKKRRVIDTTLPRRRSGMQGGTSSVVSLGDSRLAAIRDVLENGYVFTRSNTQRKFHEAFLNSCVRFLYSHDASPPDFREIMEKNNWVDIRQQCLCMTPRRFGKTVAVGMFVAAMALVVPGSDQAIFSTGRRASSKLLELVAKLIAEVPGGTERIAKSNQETVWVSHPCGSVAKINSYPSCAKTLRGVGGDVVYMEEASFMDLAVFYEVIVPLLEVDKTALICISTPQVSAYSGQNPLRYFLLFTFVSHAHLHCLCSGYA